MTAPTHGADHLIDTSVPKRLHHPAVRGIIEPLALEGVLGRASISDLEVGYSARNGDEWDRLVGALDAFSLVETTAEHVRRALQVQRLLARDSQRGRKIPDLLIAAAAEDVDATVLHYDADFDRIAAVTGQPCRWVVPVGRAGRDRGVGDCANAWEGDPMRTIDVAAIGRDAPALVADAASGETVIITRRGRPVAQLLPLGGGPLRHLERAGLIRKRRHSAADLPFPLARRASLSDAVTRGRDDERY